MQVARNLNCSHICANQACLALDAGATRVWHEEHQAPYYHYGVDWMGYDDPESLSNKVRFHICASLMDIH